LGRPKIVITDCDHGSIEEERAIFSKFGADLDLAQMADEEEIAARCRDADGLISQYAPMSRRVLESLPQCKVVSHYGVGVPIMVLGWTPLICRLPPNSGSSLLMF
jgi:D-3-phosphoglycerate dehydrogenase